MNPTAYFAMCHARPHIQFGRGNVFTDLIRTTESWRGIDDMLCEGRRRALEQIFLELLLHAEDPDKVSEYTTAYLKRQTGAESIRELPNARVGEATHIIEFVWQAVSNGREKDLYSTLT